MRNRSRGGSEVASAASHSENDKVCTSKFHFSKGKYGNIVLAWHGVLVQKAEATFQDICAQARKIFGVKDIESNKPETVNPEVRTRVGLDSESESELSEEDKGANDGDDNGDNDAGDEGGNDGDGDGDAGDEGGNDGDGDGDDDAGNEGANDGDDAGDDDACDEGAIDRDDENHGDDDTQAASGHKDKDDRNNGIKSDDQGNGGNNGDVDEGNGRDYEANLEVDHGGPSRRGASAKASRGRRHGCKKWYVAPLTQAQILNLKFRVSFYFRC